MDENRTGDLDELVAAEVDKRLADPLYLQKHLLRLVDDNKRLAESIQNMEKELEALAPAKDFYSRVTESDDWMEMSAAVKVLAYKGWGRNKVFELLRDRGIVRYNNEPFQRYVEAGYFRTIEQQFTTAYGETMINRKPMVSQKGLDFIRKLIEAEVAA